MIVCLIYYSILQADLASIHSEEENDFLHEIIGNRSIVWVGGQRSCPSCEDWVWSDGTPMDFTAWHSIQPDNAVSYIFQCLNVLRII